MSRSDVQELDQWGRVWAGQRHDHRYFDIVEGTVGQDFEYHYLILEDATGAVRGIQPLFVCVQNVLDGVHGRMRSLMARLGKMVPGLVAFRTLMVGSSVGEGGLGAAPVHRRWCAWALAQALPLAARRLGAALIVLKEFPSDLRPVLDVLVDRGFTRLASMPYVTLDLDFRDFDEHLTSLSKSARRDFRRKFKEAQQFAPLSMEVVGSISDRLDELYPLYLQVYERAKLRFEKLTPDYFRRLGQELPDRARFLIWTQAGKPVGFYSCILHDGVLWIDYIGMDYSVALDRHLYFVMKRDAINWSCRNGVRRYCGGPLNYDPKLHLGCRLKPMDLYALHLNPLLNRALAKLAPWLSPTRHDPILRKFPNANEL